MIGSIGLDKQIRTIARGGHRADHFDLAVKVPRVDQRGVVPTMLVQHLRLPESIKMRAFAEYIGIAVTRYTTTSVREMPRPLRSSAIVDAGRRSNDRN